MLILYLSLGIFILVVGVIIGYFVAINQVKYKLAELYMLYDKYFYMFKLLSLWMENIENGYNIYDKLLQLGYKKVSVYGMGFLGKRLVNQLENGGIEVAYIIDKKGGLLNGKIPVINLSSNMQDVDAIIVTPVYYYYQIKRDIRKYSSADIISLETLI